jgi:hypothetical protein
MDTAPKGEKATGSAESYPYTYYGTSYSGYGGAGTGGDSQMQRSMQDYVLILRERVWYIVLVFALVFSAAAIFTFTRVPQFQSVASVQVLRGDPVVMQVQAVVNNDIRSAEDLNTQVKVLESFAIVQRVSERLVGDELKQFLAPYTKEGSAEPVSPAEIIFKNRKIVPVRLSLVLQVQYAHPDKFIASRVANLFIDEYIAYNSRLCHPDHVPPERGRDPLAPGAGTQGHPGPVARPALHLQLPAHRPARAAGLRPEDPHRPAARPIPREAPQNDGGDEFHRADREGAEPRH